MPLIQPAKLVICPNCKAHAHILASDGTKSDEFSTKVGGVDEINSLFQRGKIVEVEGDALAKAILASPLSSSEPTITILIPVRDSKAGDAEETGLDDLFDNPLFEDFPLARDFN